MKAKIVGPEIDHKVFSFINLVGCQKSWDYYNVFNNSPYRHSYHGDSHVKLLIMSIINYSSRNKCSLEDLKDLVDISIFHDIGYYSTEDDAHNILHAINLASNFYDVFGDSSDLKRKTSVISSIGYSKFPYEVNPNISPISKIFRDVDHSGFMFPEYSLHLCTLLYRNELKEKIFKDKWSKEYERYFMTLKPETEFFSYEVESFRREGLEEFCGSLNECQEKYNSWGLI